MADETKRERSVRIANRRVNNAIKAIELLGVMASTSYDVNGEELDKITTAVSDAVVQLETIYKTGVVTASGFAL